MRKVFIIAWSSLVRTARDRRSLLLLLIMPLILVAIIGTALKKMMEPGQINPFRVIAVNLDQGSQAPVRMNFGEILVQDVLAGDEAATVIKLEESTILQEARAEVEAGRAVALVYVPAEFTADVMAGKAPSIELFADPGKPTQAGIVAQVVRYFTDALTSGTLAGKVLGPQELMKRMQETGGLGVHNPKAMPILREAASGARPVSALQYYAAAMAAMFLIMTAFSRASQILLERQQGTLARMLVTPTPTAAVVGGQMLGSMAILTAQFLILLFGTSLIYRVDWGGWAQAAALGTALALAATGISTAAAGLIREPKVADALVGIAGNLFAAFSGGMFPIYILPEGMRVVARFIPNYWALQGFLDQMAGVGTQALWLPLAVLTAMGLATGALGAWRLAAKGV